jgi:hypothetical protein
LRATFPCPRGPGTEPKAGKTGAGRSLFVTAADAIARRRTADVARTALRERPVVGCSRNSLTSMDAVYTLHDHTSTPERITWCRQLLAKVIKLSISSGSASMAWSAR